MKINISIENCSREKMSITKEPEGIELFFNPQEEIIVQTNEQTDNIAINIGKNEDGTIYVQIWDRLKTQYTIYKDGENMFEQYL